MMIPSYTQDHKIALLSRNHREKKLGAGYFFIICFTCVLLGYFGGRLEIGVRSHNTFPERVVEDSNFVDETRVGDFQQFADSSFNEPGTRMSLNTPAFPIKEESTGGIKDKLGKAKNILKASNKILVPAMPIFLIFNLVKKMLGVLGLQAGDLSVKTSPLTFGAIVGGDIGIKFKDGNNGDGLTELVQNIEAAIESLKGSSGGSKKDSALAPTMNGFNSNGDDENTNGANNGGATSCGKCKKIKSCISACFSPMKKPSRWVLRTFLEALKYFLTSFLQIECTIGWKIHSAALEVGFPLKFMMKGSLQHNPAIIDSKRCKTGMNHQIDQNGKKVYRWTDQDDKILSEFVDPKTETGDSRVDEEDKVLESEP